MDKQLNDLKTNHQDEMITFEQMGIDNLILDEAHEFKNLMTVSKLENVSGISSAKSQKAQDLLLKCRYLYEKTGGKGITFATGTPMFNSITELHTMMRYLQHDFLQEKGLEGFDQWISTFGKKKSDFELAPAGNTFKFRTRMSFQGVPELMAMFKECADIRTEDMLDLEVPNCKTEIINCEPTELQQNLMKELADRADKIQGGSVNPREDNMLKITSDGRKVGLDPRLVSPSFEDNSDTKLNQCVENVFRIWDETAPQKSTQLIFCDLGTPKRTTAANDAEKQADTDEVSVSELDSLEESGDFCIYDDVKQKLMQKGIPEHEIAYIHDAKTEQQKSELFSKVREGKVRVLLGSTAKMGIGTNVQDKLIALHDLDVPWRPADMTQRLGRMVRQGNENKDVQLYRYVTKGSFDAYSYQLLEQKQRMISQIMTSKEPARTCSDVDQEALSYAEIKTLCTGDERIKEKMVLDKEVTELKIQDRDYRNTRHEMEDLLKTKSEQKARHTDVFSELKADEAHIAELSKDEKTGYPIFKMTINGTEYTDKKKRQKRLQNLRQRQFSKRRQKAEKAQLSAISKVLQWRYRRWI